MKIYYKYTLLSYYQISPKHKHKKLAHTTAWRLNLLARMNDDV